MELSLDEDISKAGDTSIKSLTYVPAEPAQHLEDSTELKKVEEEFDAEDSLVDEDYDNAIEADVEDSDIQDSNRRSRNGLYAIKLVIPLYPYH